MQIFDRTIKEVLTYNLNKIEERFQSDVIFYYGEIHPAYIKGLEILSNN